MSFTVLDINIAELNEYRKNNPTEVDKNMKDHSKDPYFFKKAENASATVRKAKFPTWVEKRNGFLVVKASTEQ